MQDTKDKDTSYEHLFNKYLMSTYSVWYPAPLTKDIALK